MSTNPSHSISLDRPATPALRPAGDQTTDTAAQESARPETRQASGRRMIFAGFVITILGVVLYCAACFAGGMDAGMGDILFSNSVPFARGTLAVLGLGTLVWLYGSITYLRAAFDAEEEAKDDDQSASK